MENTCSTFLFNSSIFKYIISTTKNLYFLLFDFLLIVIPKATRKQRFISVLFDLVPVLLSIYSYTQHNHIIITIIVISLVSTYCQRTRELHYSCSMSLVYCYSSNRFKRVSFRLPINELSKSFSSYS